jgi:hypothetical protein
MVALRARHLWHYICKAADGNNVLLEQPDDEDKLSTLTEKVQNRLEKDMKAALTWSWLSAWR